MKLARESRWICVALLGTFARTKRMKTPIALLVVFVVLSFAMGASALAFEIPEFFSTNNVTELRYREWGALSGPVITVKIEFAIRRVEFSLYNSRIFEKDGIPAVHGERRFDVWRRGHDDKGNERIIEDENWLAILKDLSDAGLGSWRDYYCNPDVCDGALWELELLSGTNLVKRSGGSNDAPSLHYRKLLSALNRISESFGAGKIGVRTLYNDVWERAEKEPDAEKRKKLLEIIEKFQAERNAKYDAEMAEMAARRRQKTMPDSDEVVCDENIWKDEATGIVWRYDEILGEEDAGEKMVGLGMRRPAVVCKDAPKIEKIAIPGKIKGMRVEIVDEHAFAGCTNLVSVSIPAEVRGIVSTAFARLRMLERIDVHEDNENYKSCDGVLYSKDGSSLIAWPKATKSFCVTVPGNVRRIVSDAFDGCWGIAALTIPASVTNQVSFRGCQSLAGVVFEGGVPVWSDADIHPVLPKGCIIYADGAPSEVAYRRTRPLAEARVRVVSLVPFALRGVPSRVGRFAVERRSLLARDEDAVGYSFNEWDVETAASADCFVAIGLDGEKALIESARKVNARLAVISVGGGVRKIEGNPYSLFSMDNQDVICSNIESM